MIFPEKIIRELLEKSSGILMSSFGPAIQIEPKENQNSIVTALDIEVEKSISSILAAEYPSHNMIGEELGFVSKNSEYTWVIDPLDGTSNYAAGIPWFGILIALFRNDRPIAAGACLPFFKWVYYAEPGKGAACNGTPIHVTRESSLKNTLFAYSTDYLGDDAKTRSETGLLSEVIKNTRNFRSSNCLIDLCFVADGKLGGCINHCTKIWDIAAPWLIIKEAGGHMTGLDGKEIQFDLTPGNFLKNYPVLATSESLFNEITGLIRRNKP